MCNPADKPETNAGALQIEVTPEMLKAGAARLQFHAVDLFDTQSVDRTNAMLADIFAAMICAGGLGGQHGTS